MLGEWALGEVTHHAHRRGVHVLGGPQGCMHVSVCMCVCAQSSKIQMIPIQPDTVVLSCYYNKNRVPLVILCYSICWVFLLLFSFAFPPRKIAGEKNMDEKP